MTNDDIQFREKEDVAGFLGIHIDLKRNGTIHLTQVRLQKQIATALHLDGSDVTPVDTPSTGFLPIDEDGEPPHGSLNYASVIGQLNYLSGLSRCDITMATSQVARYLHRPKLWHQIALIQIGRYLKGAIGEGTDTKAH